MCDLSSQSLVPSGFSPLFWYIQIYLTPTTFESESEIEIVMTVLPSLAPSKSVIYQCKKKWIILIN